MGTPADLYSEEFFNEIYENIINRKWIGQSAIILGEKKTGKTHLARLWIKSFADHDLNVSILFLNLAKH